MSIIINEIWLLLSFSLDKEVNLTSTLILPATPNTSVCPYTSHSHLKKHNLVSVWYMYLLQPYFSGFFCCCFYIFHNSVHWLLWPCLWLSQIISFKEENCNTFKTLLWKWGCLPLVNSRVKLIISNRQRPYLISYISYKKEVKLKTLNLTKSDF